MQMKFLLRRSWPINLIYLECLETFLLLIFFFTFFPFCMMASTRSVIILKRPSYRDLHNWILNFLLSWLRLLRLSKLELSRTVLLYTFKRMSARNCILLFICNFIQNIKSCLMYSRYLLNITLLRQLMLRLRLLSEHFKFSFASFWNNRSLWIFQYLITTFLLLYHLPWFLRHIRNVTQRKIRGPRSLCL